PRLTSGSLRVQNATMTQKGRNMAKHNLNCIWKLWTGNREPEPDLRPLHGDHSRRSRAARCRQTARKDSTEPGSFTADTNFIRNNLVESRGEESLHAARHQRAAKHNRWTAGRYHRQRGEEQ